MRPQGAAAAPARPLREASRQRARNVRPPMGSSPAGGAPPRRNPRDQKPRRSPRDDGAALATGHTRARHNATPTVSLCKATLSAAGLGGDARAARGKGGGADSGTGQTATTPLCVRLRVTFMIISGLRGARERSCLRTARRDKPWRARRPPGDGTCWLSPCAMLRPPGSSVLPGPERGRPQRARSGYSEYVPMRRSKHITSWPKFFSGNLRGAWVGPRVWGGGAQL